MRPNKEKIYDLSELTSEEREELANEVKNPYIEKECELTQYLIYTNSISHWQVSEYTNKETVNAKELFYTLENIQVDCRELSEEQIKEMADVFYNNKYENKYALDVLNEEVFLRCREHGVKAFGTYDKKEGLFLITYDKFMELFGNKEETQLDRMLIKEEKPKHYSKGIDTFARMEANCTKEECLAFVKGNIDKYNFRTKGQDLEDYKKIVAYANWAIKILEDAKKN